MTEKSNEGWQPTQDAGEHTATAPEIAVAIFSKVMTTLAAEVLKTSSNFGGCRYTAEGPHADAADALEFELKELMVLAPALPPFTTLEIFREDLTVGLELMVVEGNDTETS